MRSVVVYCSVMKVYYCFNCVWFDNRGKSAAVTGEIKRRFQVYDDPGFLLSVNWHHNNDNRNRVYV